MKVLFFLTFFYNTVLTHKYFPPYETVFSRHAFDFDTNSKYDYPSFYLEPPIRTAPRALAAQDHHNNRNKPAGPHVQARQTLSSSSSEYDPNTIVHPQHETVPDDTPTNITGRNCFYNLCEEAEDYPGEYVKAILRSTNAFDSFFQPTLPDIASKNFGAENLCDSRVEIKFPKTAVNMKNITRFVANVDKYQQGVKVEICNMDNTPCQLSEFFPKSYESICEQRYTVVPLLALDDDKNPIVDTFQLPSCCVCMYKRA